MTILNRVWNSHFIKFNTKKYSQKRYKYPIKRKYTHLLYIFSLFGKTIISLQKNFVNKQLTIYLFYSIIVPLKL